ncbi:hypothetical protein, partial [Vibrio anguillarum]|uniref:hypothetical protein n=1 Tax=Vibrio anguillarum TaxID=55601 RepID=UPI001F309C1D
RYSCAICDYRFRFSHCLWDVKNQHYFVRIEFAPHGAHRSFVLLIVSMALAGIGFLSLLFH